MQPICSARLRCHTLLCACILHTNYPSLSATASSRSSASLGSSITGLYGPSPMCAAVRLDVAPCCGAPSFTGERNISSLLGTGRLTAKSAAAAAEPFTRRAPVQRTQLRNVPRLLAHAHLLLEHVHLVLDEGLHSIHLVLVFKRKIACLQATLFKLQSAAGGTHSVTCRLIRRMVPHLEIRMRERLLAAHTLGGVEAEHLRQRVQCERVRPRVHCRERNVRLEGERANIILRLRHPMSGEARHKNTGAYTERSHPPEGFFRRASQIMKYLVQLIDVAFTKINSGTA